jgi:hypothetical protein
MVWSGEFHKFHRRAAPGYCLLFGDVGGFFTLLDSVLVGMQTFSTLGKGKGTGVFSP